MKTYHITDEPIELNGLEVIDPANERYWRLPDDESARVSEAVRARSKSACGGRARFLTDARTLTISMRAHTLGVDPCIPVCGSAGADVMRGAGENAAFVGIVSPGRYDKHSFEATFTLDGSLQPIVVNLPRNDHLADARISVDDGARVLKPLKYNTPGKICFYGSSITEGGCATRAGNAYAAAAARWLDSDYVNYGFSGAARGEDEMADIICARDFSALVYDYDHNAPDAEHLKRTHARFFGRVRAAHPKMPVLMLSRPAFDAHAADNGARRDIILSTYLSARAAGDDNVYFLDGEQFFGGMGREMCTVDGTHPNDLGFYRMAISVYGALKKIL